MYPSAHFASGIFVVAILLWFNIISTPLLMLVILIGVVIPDLDFLLSKKAPDKNHRRLLTHTPIFWVTFLLLDFFLLHTVLIFWFSLAALIHIFLDVLDWGVMLGYPVSNKLCNHILSEEKIDFSSNHFMRIQCNFLSVYFKNKYILGIEIAIGILAAISTTLFFKLLIAYFLVYIALISIEIAFLKKVCSKFFNEL